MTLIDTRAVPPNKPFNLETHQSNPQQGPSNPLPTQLHPPHLMLIQQKHLPIPPKAKIRTRVCSRKTDLAYQLSARRPDMHAVATTTVDIAKSIAFDAIRYAR